MTTTRRYHAAIAEPFVVQIGAATLELVEGDIVVQEVDAVVNAANEHLAHGSGVCGALHKASGARDLEHACAQLGHCPTGEARLTPGFKLPARYIIHAVGPRYNRRNPTQSANLLARAYRSSLELASQNNVHSVAFPSLSTGLFGYPVNTAAPIALSTVIKYLNDYPEVKHVRFVLREEAFPAYRAALRNLMS